MLNNEPEILKILSQRGAKVFYLRLLFSDDLSLIMRTLSLVSNKNFLFLWRQMLKLSKEDK